MKEGVQAHSLPLGPIGDDPDPGTGDLAARLTHPSHEVEREYEVKVLGVPDEHDLERLSKGIVIGGRRTLPAEVKVVNVIAGKNGEHAVLSIVVKEGRNRQVRKMCDAIGHPVTHLKRTAIGPIRDTTLKPGRWRELREDEVKRLRGSAKDPKAAKNRRDQ